MYNYDNIGEIHLEVTSKCNASCPMCSRNIHGGAINPFLPLTELSLDDSKIIFPGEFIKQLNAMFMCGTYGDPMVAKDTLAIFEYFRMQNSNMKLSMNTNGSGRKTDWWRNLATVLIPGIVIFGIDGLSDTNHLYRKGTQFEKIMENVEAFINAGGKAHWDYIVFKHNEHQIEEARILATKMGFEKFTVKKTSRFFDHKLSKNAETYDVYDNDGNVTYKLEQPSIQFQNKSILNVPRIIEEYGSFDEYFDETSIDCKALSPRRQMIANKIVAPYASPEKIYVSAEGYVFPCCWTGGQIYNYGPNPKLSPIVKMINATGGIDKINAKYIPIKEIVVGEFFQKIKASWELDSIDCGKLKVCATQCAKGKKGGLNFDKFYDMYK